MKVNKLYMTIDCDKATDSLFSLYHRKLWDQYNLFGLESFDDEILKKEYMKYLYIPIKDESGEYYNNFFISDIKDEDVNFSKEYLIENYNIENEILSYMKYGVFNSLIDFGGRAFDINDNSSMNELENSISEASDLKPNSDMYQKFYEKYFDFKDDINTLESYARNANNYVNSYINKLRNISFSTSESEGGASNNKSDLESLNNNLNNIYTNLNNFKTKMADFRNVIRESKSRYLIDKTRNINMSPEVATFIEEEYEYYEAYVDENSDMNLTVEREKDDIEDKKEVINNYLRDVVNLINEIKSIKNEIRDIRSDRDMDSSDKADIISELNDMLDYLYEDCGDLGKELRYSKSSFQISELNLLVSPNANNSETKIFDRILELKNNGFLSLVLDSNEIDDIKNDNISRNDFNIKSKRNIIDKILLSEYELNYFNYYNKEDFDKTTKSNSESLEVEYLLSGKASDREAISAVTNKILLMREGFNIIYLYTNSEKRREARLLSSTLFAAFSPIVQETMFIVILSAWAASQALLDTSNLLHMKRVPIMHDDDTWEYDTHDILSLSRDKLNMGGESIDDEGRGLNYIDYLRIFLISENQDIINSRLTSIIDHNISEDEDSFNMNNMIFSMDFNHLFRCKHYFTNFILYEPDNTRLDYEYKMTINTHYDYIE